MSAYDELGPLYDAWCRSVTEDVGFYVELAVESGGPVLEIGVGSGRIAVPTALAGVPVVGIDTSPGMLELTRERADALGLPIELHQADMRALPDLGSFPLVTIPFRALLHLRSDEERRQVLTALHARLSPGGRLAFDVFHPSHRDIDETHGVWLEREPGIQERAIWRAEERSLTLTVRAGGTKASMELWWVDPDDWRRLLRASGFEPIESYGWFDRGRLRAGSSDSVWIATRPDRDSGSSAAAASGGS
jgi:SAM-dependent methyltransferase